jgi:hypothetical protein
LEWERRGWKGGGLEGGERSLRVGRGHERGLGEREDWKGRGIEDWMRELEGGEERVGRGVGGDWKGERDDWKGRRRKGDRRG